MFCYHATEKMPSSEMKAFFGCDSAEATFRKNSASTTDTAAAVSVFCVLLTVCILSVCNLIGGLIPVLLIALPILLLNVRIRLWTLRLRKKRPIPAV